MLKLVSISKLMRDELIKLKDKISVEIKQANSLKELFLLEKKYLGRRGEFTQALKKIRELSEKEKPIFGRLARDIKQQLTTAFREAKSVLGGEADVAPTSQAATFDPTLPGRRVSVGKLHPITQLRWQVEDIFLRMGFIIEDGPEIESDWYNFEALNIPAWHPARDIQDTFYIENQKNKRQKSKLLLRTHTSPVQVRAMEKYGVPLRIIVPGRVYRNEATDARHETCFWQVEGLVIGKDIALSHLKAIIGYVIDQLLGVRVRWRPGYFPFTEPSLEMDIECLLCQRRGCRVCKDSGWLEFMGAGLVHPNVLRAGNIEPGKFSGFAFGFGLTRLAMLKWRIDDIRLFLSGDLRFLEQF